MQKRIFNIFLLLVLLLTTQCSTKKNTATRRAYHYVTARYNVNFNAKQAFLKGDEEVTKKSQDDYNELLHIFPSSNKDAAELSGSSMDVVLEKCQKSIKSHSIVKKPKKKANKAHDAKYQAFMKKEEYNPMVQEAWLLMGKAQYYKADYAAAGATFLYIGRHFTDNRDVCTESKLCLARTYAEQAWYYEAEEVIGRLNEQSFSTKTSRLFVPIRIDLLLRQKLYTESLPYFETALKQARRKEAPRLYFIYGQVLELLGRYGDAYKQYELCLKGNPLHEMEFNASLNQARCYQGNDVNSIQKDLDKLLKKQSNAVYADQIYYAKAQLYQRSGQEKEAIDNYRLAIDKSQRQGYDKAKALLALGTIYFDKQDFMAAQPLYNEALPLIPLQYEGYDSIAYRTAVLSEVARSVEVVQLEDSLQMLAALPDAQKVEKIKEVIARKRAEEAEMQRKLEEEARIQEIREQNAAMGQAVSLGDNSWYFYNSTLVGKGKVEFKKNWGNRVLEDDWRRANKMLAFAEADTEDEEETSEVADSTAAVTTLDELASLVESLQNDDDEAEITAYLRQLPVSEAKKAASNQRIAENLHLLVGLYDDKLHNDSLALSALAELARRFPQFDDLDADYYRAYGIYKEAGDETGMASAKSTLLTQYPNSKYTRLLQNQKLAENEAANKEETLYRATYTAYTQGNASLVRQNYEQAKVEYPDSYLMPKFMMLDVLSHGLQDGQEHFVEQLQALIDTYPESEVAPLARDMVALSKQGRQVQSETSATAITEQRQKVVSEEEFAENIQKAGFQYEPDAPHRFILLVYGIEADKNTALFNVATYNFTRFMIKDYDLQVRDLGDSLYAISVSGLENQDEAVWYQNGLLSDATLSAQLQSLEYYQAFVVSDKNFKLIYDPESATKYIEFYRQNQLQINEDKTVKELEQSAGFVKEGSEQK